MNGASAEKNYCILFIQIFIFVIDIHGSRSNMKYCIIKIEVQRIKRIEKNLILLHCECTDTTRTKHLLYNYKHINKIIINKFISKFRKLQIIITSWKIVFKTFFFLFSRVDFTSPRCSATWVTLIILTNFLTLSKF